MVQPRRSRHARADLIFRIYQQGSFPINALIGRDGRLARSGCGLDASATDAMIQPFLDETPAGDSSWSAVKALFRVFASLFPA